MEGQFNEECMENFHVGIFIGTAVIKKKIETHRKNDTYLQIAFYCQLLFSRAMFTLNYELKVPSHEMNQNIYFRSSYSLIQRLNNWI